MERFIKISLYGVVFGFVLVLSSFFNLCSAQSVLTDAELKAKYQNNNIKILIVPGHDGESQTGTYFKGIYERDLNLQLADDLYNLLENDGHFSVFITRDKNGYLPIFENYFKDQATSTRLFIEKYKQITDSAIANGTFKVQTDGIDHPVVANDYALRLYGTNKWADENNIDIVINIHFDDYPGRSADQVGVYSGFSIYAPESQLVNSEISQSVAKSVSVELSKVQSSSDYQPEHTSVVDDQDLIAIGANSTLNAAAILVEYGYIYESQIINKNIRSVIFPEYAYKTYLGVVKFLDDNFKVNGYDSALLPYKFSNNLYFGMRNNSEVAKLQEMLNYEGFYSGPITGNFLHDTQQAVIDLQKNNTADISVASGYVGPQTVKLLNKKEIESFSYVWNDDLYYGMKNNADVRALQEILSLEGFYNGPITGNFLNLTRQSVITCQKKSKFSSNPGTGYVGPLTRGALNNLYSVSQ
jgi:N-acetylmuramoyl-L-alanine amidase